MLIEQFSPASRPLLRDPKDLDTLRRPGASYDAASGTVLRQLDEGDRDDTPRMSGAARLGILFGGSLALWGAIIYAILK